MTPAQALNELMNSPQNFLKHYPVKCAGSSAPIGPGVANTKPYYLNKQGAGQDLFQGQVLGHRGATRPGFLGHQRQISSFLLSPTNSAGAANIASAHVVPMVNYNSTIYGCPNLATNINAMPHYVLDGTGDGLMVTGELSACCFCFHNIGGSLYCTHVQPRDGVTADQLDLWLSTNGHFAAAPLASLGTFGRSRYTMRASVIGVRVGGVWNLYAQTSSDNFKTLTGAFKIYPGATTRL